MKTKLKIKGWDFLPFNVKDSVLDYIKLHGLPWFIVSDGTLEYFDIVIEVDHGGCIAWGESVKILLAAIIFMLLHADRTGNAGLAAMALDMTPPSGVATPDLD